MEAFVSYRSRIGKSLTTCQPNHLIQDLVCKQSYRSARCSAHNSLERHKLTVRRSFHTGSQYRDELKGDSRSRSLGDFYEDLLAQPIPKTSKAKTDLPTFVDTRGDATKEERAAKLFGNIKGSGYERRTSDTPDATWRTINGVPIPPRPTEPDNCCMSGCAQWVKTTAM